MEHPTGTDRSTAARLKEQLEQMDETAFDESVFRDYLRELGDTVEPEQPIDVQASLRDFEQKHAVLISQLDRQAQSRTAASRSAHRRRLGYRLLLIAAAVAVLNAMCIAAFGRGLGHYTAKWGSETFGFFQGDDFETSSDGKIIYYPDGRIDDRTDMPDYDHETYTALPESDVEEEPIENLEPAEETGPLPEYADLPDTDLSRMGLTKENSHWNGSHSVEYFNITHSTLAEVLEKMNIPFHMAPTSFPDGFSLEYITVTKDYLFDETSFFANYVNGEHELAVSIRPYQNAGARTVEKDNRTVIQYEVGGTEWYIMHNLENLSAVSINSVYETLIYGNASVDEMKSIIDSIYA